jgi:hypothetical protein
MDGHNALQLPNWCRSPDGMNSMALSSDGQNLHTTQAMQDGTAAARRIVIYTNKGSK